MNGNTFGPWTRFLVLVSLYCSLVLRRSTFALEFNPNGNFKIVYFTDLHYGEGKDKDDNNDLVRRWCVPPYGLLSAEMLGVVS